jgi:uncharacterized protein (TIGR02466 family)
LIHDIFPTPIVTVDLSSHLNLDELKKTVDELSLEMDAHDLISNGESSYATIRKILDCEELNYLRQVIQSEIRILQTKMGIKCLTFTNSWINVMNESSHVDEHIHGMSVISGAFYINAEEGSGNLFIKNPNHESQMLYDKLEDTCYSQEYIEIEVKSGLLVLFPSWLRHHVRTNGYNNRTVLSFNTMYTDYIKKNI